MESAGCPVSLMWASVYARDQGRVLESNGLVEQCLARPIIGKSVDSVLMQG
jgi:hypothetical protein